MEVAGVQGQVVHVGEAEAHHGAAVGEGRHALDDVSVQIAVVVLREVDEVGRPVVVHRDVDARQLVEPHVVVPHRTHDRHQVAQSGCQLPVHPQEVVPGVGAGRHVVVVGDVAPHEEDVGLEGGCDAGEVDRGGGVAGIAGVDHADGAGVVVGEGAVDGVGPELVIVEHLGEVLGVRLQPRNQGRVHLPRSLPLQSLVVDAVRSHVQEGSGVRRRQLLVEDSDWPRLGVRVEVEEEGVAGVLGHSRVHLAGRAHGAGSLELVDAAEVGVDAEPQSVVVVADLSVVETQAGLVHEAGEHHRADGRDLQQLLGLRGQFETQRQVGLQSGSLLPHRHRFPLPLLAPVVQVDLQRRHRHHPQHALHQVEDVQRRAEQRDDGEADETAVEGEVLKAFDEGLTAGGQPSVLRTLSGHFADDEVGDETEEGEDEEDETGDSCEPLVVVEVLSLQVGHPVELSHGDLQQLQAIHYGQHTPTSCDNNSQKLKVNDGC